MIAQTDKTLSGGRSEETNGSVVVDFRRSVDNELDDLIYSWKRVTDPKLRKIALDLIRSMASPQS